MATAHDSWLAGRCRAQPDPDHGRPHADLVEPAHLRPRAVLHELVRAAVGVGQHLPAAAAVLVDPHRGPAAAVDPAPEPELLDPYRRRETLTPCPQAHRLQGPPPVEPLRLTRLRTPQPHASRVRTGC